MILNISDADFKRIMNDEQLFLPIQWDGNDFYSTLESLFDHYINQLTALFDAKNTFSSNIYLNISNISHVCDFLKKNC